MSSTNKGPNKAVHKSQGSSVHSAEDNQENRSATPHSGPSMRHARVSTPLEGTHALLIFVAETKRLRDKEGKQSTHRDHIFAEKRPEQTRPANSRNVRSPATKISPYSSGPSGDLNDSRQPRQPSRPSSPARSTVATNNVASFFAKQPRSHRSKTAKVGVEIFSKLFLYALRLYDVSDAEKSWQQDSLGGSLVACVFWFFFKWPQEDRCGYF